MRNTHAELIDGGGEGGQGTNTGHGWCGIAFFYDDDSVLVYDIGEPAASASIQTADEIVSMNKFEVYSESVVDRQLALAPGVNVIFGVRRCGAALTTEYTARLS
jgi:hypothetical protein